MGGVERVMGIEPTWPAWKAGALPLSYSREEAAEAPSHYTTDLALESSPVWAYRTNRFNTGNSTRA